MRPSEWDRLMTYSERDLMNVFFKPITACLLDSSEKWTLHAQNKKPAVSEDGGLFLARNKSFAHLWRSAYGGEVSGERR